MWDTLGPSLMRCRIGAVRRPEMRAHFQHLACFLQRVSVNMGGGGRRLLTNDERGHRAPHARPPFTVGQLRNAIPAHCFNKSLLRSFHYLTVDLLMASGLLYSTAFITPSTGPLGWIWWFLYWVAQGCVLTGAWVIAHECGHHAFSDYPLVDDMVGLVVHSWLFVPYFSWRISHRRHHSNTGSMTTDEVFIPKTRDALGVTSPFWNSPPGRLLYIVLTLTLGWPLYAAFNVGGRRYGRFTTLFDPNAPIFSSKERLQVLISNAALLAVVATLYKLASAYGLPRVLKVYGVPLLIVNGFFILITLLNHTHPSLPHYSDAEWEWLRGALSTVDRDYGILNLVFHHAADTHVLHHIFPSIPHYHAEEATKAIKPILGDYYQYDDTPIVDALWREFKECIFVAPDSQEEGDGVFWFKSKSNLD